MRLSRLYSNKPEVFRPIEFNEGLSAVLAEIRIPENRLIDVHNLGKTTVGQLIDFCLLKKKSASFFLFKHSDVFGSFVFYLEVCLPDGRFLTIGRRVDPGSRVEFKRSQDSIADASVLTDSEWSHHDVSFERAKTLLDGILAIDALRPWGFRKLVGYLIRTQQDYQDVFQLGKFSGKHQDWKPFVAHLLGLPAEDVIRLYEKRTELDETTAHLETLTREWGAEDPDPSMLDALISVKRREVDSKEATLDSFDFGEEDHQVVGEVVDDIEARLSGLNEEAYHLAQIRRQLEDSLSARELIFRPRDAEALFRDAGVFFDGQLTKDFDQLIEFNRAITEERRSALQTQLELARAREDEVEAELRQWNETRSRSLDYLRESDSLAKYKRLASSLTTLRAELAMLESQRAAVGRLVELRREVREIREEFGRLQSIVEAQIDQVSQDDHSLFGTIRTFFTDIVSEVIGEKAVLTMHMNSQGGVEFRAEFIGGSGVATSGDRGTSYKKLLCIAFDLSVLRAYAGVRFPRFVYLDGALEQLEPRKREKLLAVFREYAALGLQPVISLLDSDLPQPLDSGATTLASSDVVLTLHDEGEDGRLFKMASW